MSLYSICFHCTRLCNVRHVILTPAKVQSQQQCGNRIFIAVSFFLSYFTWVRVNLNCGYDDLYGLKFCFFLSSFIHAGYLARFTRGTLHDSHTIFLYRHSPLCSLSSSPLLIAFNLAGNSSATWCYVISAAPLWHHHCTPTIFFFFSSYFQFYVGSM